ncbi:unnamed protein product [Sympodiomycopsis kandeliae]
MARSASGHHSKGRSEGARPTSNHGGAGGGAGGGGFASFSAWRPGSRRSSKIPSEDGHSVSGAAAGMPGAAGLTPSSSGLSHSHSINRDSRSPAVMDRHARMRMAMSEAQNDPIGHTDHASRNNEDDEEDQERDDYNRNYYPYSVDGTESPRTKLAAGQAKAHAAAAVAAAQKAAQDGSIQNARSQGDDKQSTAANTKPGEGTLTFDLLGGGDGDGANNVVLADGVPLSASGLQTTFNNQQQQQQQRQNDSSSSPARPGMGPRSSSASSIQRDVITDSPTQTRQNSTTADLASTTTPNRTATSLTVPESGSNGSIGQQDRGRRQAPHNMHPSASTSALSPGPFHRLRKLSDASSAGGDPSRSREQSPTKSRKSNGGSSKKSSAPHGFGLAAALAASGAGVAGYGLQDPRHYSRSQSGQGQPIDKDYVGSSQGGVYRDPKSGLVVEKGEDGQEVHYRPGAGSRTVSRNDTNASLRPPGQEAYPASRRASSSGHSYAGSDSSDASGLGAAASFPAMQAGALLTPALSHAANAPGAPTIALDSANAEHYSQPGGQKGSSGVDGGGQANNEQAGATFLSANVNRSDDSAASSATVIGGASWPGDMGAQITGFAVASSKRNAEFHALFPTVPEDDYLIEDYGCAMVREILIQGRIYISENYVCFNANIFGWVTNIVLAFSEIVSIEKRMTARIIPNAIQISSLHVKHTFSSFLSRDTTYDLMANIWKLSHPDVPIGAEAEVSDDESEAPGAGGDDTENKSTGDAMDSKLGKRARLKKKFIGAKNQKDANGNPVAGSGSGANGSAAKADGGQSGGKTDSSGGKPAKRAKHPKTSCPCEGEKKHLAVIPLDTTYACTPEKLYNLLFKEDFMKSFWTDNQKLDDLQVGDWNGDKREFNYIKPLNNSVGPKQTKCMITDENVHFDTDDYVTVLTTTRTPDVPAGNSFSVKTRTCLTWNGNGNVTRMYVTCATEWTGRSMLRSIIDKASIDGQKQYYQDLDQEIKKHMKENPDKFKEEGDDDDDGVEDVNEKSGQETIGVGGSDEGAEKGVLDSSSGSAGQTDGGSGGLLDQIMDIGSTAFSTAGDLLGSLSELSPSMLILGSIVIFLVLTNIWALSSSNAGRGHQRDPLDPHRLMKPKSSPHSNSATEVAEAVRDVLRDYLHPAHSTPVHRYRDRRHLSISEEVEQVHILMDEIESRMARLKEEWKELSLNAETQSGADAGKNYATKGIHEGSGKK